LLAVFLSNCSSILPVPLILKITSSILEPVSVERGSNTQRTSLTHYRQSERLGFAKHWHPPYP
jgi:hypothetical protein